MPRPQPTEQEKALKSQFDALLKSMKTKDEPAVDVARAITLFEKAQKNIAQAIAVLKGEKVEEELEPGKKRAGRPRKVVEAADGELFSGASEAAGEPVMAEAAKPVKKKRGAATEAESA